MGEAKKAHDYLPFVEASAVMGGWRRAQGSREGGGRALLPSEAAQGRPCGSDGAEAKTRRTNGPNSGGDRK